MTGRGLNAPREVWAHIAMAARQHRDFRPQQLAGVTHSAYTGVKDTGVETKRLREICEFLSLRFPTKTMPRAGISSSRAAGPLFRLGHDMYTAALEILTEDGSFTPDAYERSELQGDYDSDDSGDDGDRRLTAWCEENVAAVTDPYEAQEKYFTTWDRVFGYYDPVGKAFLRLVTDDRGMDLHRAYEKARLDFVVSKGLKPDVGPTGFVFDG